MFSALVLWDEITALLNVKTNGCRWDSLIDIPLRRGPSWDSQLCAPPGVSLWPVCSWMLCVSVSQIGVIISECWGSVLTLVLIPPIEASSFVALQLQLCSSLSPSVTCGLYRSTTCSVHVGMLVLSAILVFFYFLCDGDEVSCISRFMYQNKFMYVQQSVLLTGNLHFLKSQHWCYLN